MLAAIPYTTFPDLPFGLRTFGLMVALGVLLGARLGSDYAERFGIDREDTYRTGTLMVLAGIIGSRVTWVLSHFDEVAREVDGDGLWNRLPGYLLESIAIWKGGIQFAGGFIAALIVGWPMFRKWAKVQRWHVLNGYAWGLTAGVAIGRIGCYAVGEHFGRTTDFFLGTRYEGGDVREASLGDVPLQEGMVFHNTSLYEFLWLVALFAVMTWLIWRARRAAHEVLPATLVALFFVWYGVARFLTDTLRVNDERTFHMTGAQWMSLVMVPYGIWLFTRTRPKLRKLVGEDGRELVAAASLLSTDDEAAAEGDSEVAPDELEPPDNGEPDESEPTEDEEPTKDGEPDESEATEPTADADEGDEQPASSEEAEPIADDGEQPGGKAEPSDEPEPADAD